MKLFKARSIKAYLLVDESGLFIFKTGSHQQPKDYMASDADWHLPDWLSGSVDVWINLPEPLFDTISPPPSLSWWDRGGWLIHQRQAYRDNNYLLGYKRIPKTWNWQVAASPSAPLLSKLIDFLAASALHVQAFYLVTFEKIPFMRLIQAQLFTHTSPTLLWIEDYGAKRLVHTILHNENHILTRFILAHTSHDHANHIGQTLAYSRRYLETLQPDIIYISPSPPPEITYGCTLTSMTPQKLHTLTSEMVGFTALSSPLPQSNASSSFEIITSYTSFFTWFYQASPAPEGLPLFPTLRTVKKLPISKIGWAVAGCTLIWAAFRSQEAWNTYTTLGVLKETEKSLKSPPEASRTTSTAIFQEAFKAIIPSQASPRRLLNLFSQALPVGLFLKSWQWQITKKSWSITFVCCVDPTFQNQQIFLCRTFLDKLLILFPQSHFSHLDAPYSVYHTGSWKYDFDTSLNTTPEESSNDQSLIAAQGTLVCPLKI